MIKAKTAESLISALLILLVALLLTVSARAATSTANCASPGPPSGGAPTDAEIR